MTREIVVRVRCNACGTEVDEPAVVEMKVGNKPVIMDLCAKCFKPVHDLYRKGDKPARRPDPVIPDRRPVKNRTITGQDAESRKKELAPVREWAEANGLGEFHSRIPTKIIMQYNEVHKAKVRTTAEVLAERTAS